MPKITPISKRAITGDQIGIPVGTSFKRAIEEYAQLTGVGGISALIRPLIYQALLRSPEFREIWTEQERIFQEEIQAIQDQIGA